MKELKYIFLIILFFVCGTITPGSYDEIRKVLLTGSIPLQERKTAVYELGEKLSNTDAERTLLLCDSLLDSDNNKNSEFKEWIKLMKCYCLRKSNYKKGVFELLKSIDTGTDKEFKMYVEGLLGRYFLVTSDYNSALGYFQNNLIYHTDVKPDLKKQAQVIGSISNCYRRMKMFEQTLHFSLKAIEIATQTKDPLNIYEANNALALYYLDVNEFLKADSIYDHISGLDIKQSKKSAMAFYNNRAEIKIRLQKPAEAEVFAEKCFKIASEERDTFWIMIALVSKGNIGAQRSNYAMAINSCKTAFEYSKKTKSLIWQKNACMCLYENYYNSKKYKEAIDYFVIGNALGDSILSERNKKEMTRKEFQFEYQLKATADSIKQVEGNKVKDLQIKAQESQLKQEKIVRISLFVVAFLILAFAVFIYNRFKITQKQKLIIENQKSELEVKQKEILDSIHYAKRIQTSLLPSVKYISKNIPK